jgi:hypothetical protein
LNSHGSRRAGNQRSKGTHNKYRNRPITIDGRKFQSTKEGRRYAELKVIQKAGHVSNLMLQQRIPLHGIDESFICHYIADFIYSKTDESPVILNEKGKIIGFTDDAVVEDTKGMKTDVYKLKSKLFAAEYGFRILES